MVHQPVFPSAAAANLSARVTNQTARIAELEQVLIEERAIQDEQAETIRLRNAEINDRDILTNRLKAERDAAVSGRENWFAGYKTIKSDLEAQIRLHDDLAARFDKGGRELADCRNAATALQEAGARNERALADARAEVERLTRELEGAHAEIAAMVKETSGDTGEASRIEIATHRDNVRMAREAVAAMVVRTGRAEAAMLGLAYRLGALENERIARSAHAAHSGDSSETMPAGESPCQP